MVRKSTVHRNPIGSASEAEQRQRSRQSLRRRIMEVSSAGGLDCSTEGLLEVNPALADVSHGTRIAYAKFMTAKLKKDLKFEDEKVTMENERSRARETKAFNKFKSHAGILKKRVIEKSTVEQNDQQVQGTAKSYNDDQRTKDFRSRTPIEEESSEHIPTPDRPSTPEKVLDEASSAALAPKQTSSPPEAQEATCNLDSLTEKPAPVSAHPIAESEESSQIKTPELLVTEDKNDEENEKPTKKLVAKSSDSAASNVTSSSSHVPSISTGDKGKSKITGKTLTGWI